jgi:hypothetical protein
VFPAEDFVTVVSALWFGAFGHSYQHSPIKFLVVVASPRRVVEGEMLGAPAKMSHWRVI